MKVLLVRTFDMVKISAFLKRHLSIFLNGKIPQSPTLNFKYELGRSGTSPGSDHGTGDRKLNSLRHRIITKYTSDVSHSFCHGSQPSAVPVSPGGL